MDNTTPTQPPQESPQSPTPNPPSPPTPKSNKTTITIFSIITAVALGIAAFFAYQNHQLKQQSLTQTQTPASPEPSPDLSPESNDLDPTAAWQTYSNSLYQIRYPADVKVEETEGAALRIYKWGPTQREGTEVYDGIILHITPKEISDDLDKYVQAKIFESTSNGISEIISGPSPVTINGYQGRTYVSRSLGESKYTILQSNDKVMFVEISDGTTDPGNLGFTNTVTQILSTFTFE